MTNKKMEKNIEEIWELFRETAERFKETDRQFKEIAKNFEETDQKFKETDERLERRFNSTDKQLKELGKQIGGLGNKFGSFTEGMAFPSLQRILMDQFKMEFVSPRVKVRKKGEIIELDVLAYADEEINKVYVVEVKSHLHRDDIETMIYDLKRFPQFFPEHKDKALYGIIAAVYATEEIKKKVQNAGLHLALIRDDTFCLDAPKGFKAKRFN